MKDGTEREGSAEQRRTSRRPDEELKQRRRGALYGNPLKCERPSVTINTRHSLGVPCLVPGLRIMETSGGARVSSGPPDAATGSVTREKGSRSIE